MSQKCPKIGPFKTGIPKNQIKIYKSICKFITDYAATINNIFVPWFFSAAKKDYHEELKNGHL